MFDKYDVKKKLKIKLKSPGELQVRIQGTIFTS